MRKLSYKWPIWLTLFCFAGPIFYLLFRVGVPEIIDVEKIADEALGCFGVAIIVWLVYGLACLVSQKKR